MKKFLEFLLIVSLCIIIFGCQIKEEKPIPGGSIRIAWASGLVGLDPSKDWGCAGAMKLIRMVYSPLYNQEEQEMDITQKLTPTPDYKEWEFVLRKDCYFHYDPCFAQGNRLVNAYDVKYTYDLIKNNWSTLEPVNNIQDIIILDSFRVKFVLNQPDKNFLNKLNKGMLYIVPFEAREEYGDNFSFHPVGSGPFAFESWNEKELVLIKNKRFWVRDRWGQKLPYLDKIVIIFFPDVNQGINALFTGVVDLSPLTMDVAESFFTKEYGKIGLKKEFAQRFQIIQCPFPSLTVLLFNSRENFIFRNPVMRRALNYSINREELKKFLIMPGIKIADGPTLYPLDDFRYEYNPKKAVELIKKAGHEKRLKNLKFQYYPAPFSKAMAQILQRQLYAIGIESELVCASRVAVLRGNPEWDFGLVSILFPDSIPETQLSIYSTQEAPWVDFKSEVFDSLWDLFKTFPDRSLLVGMDSLVLKNPPFVFLYWSYPMFLADKRFKGIDPLLLLTPYIYITNE
ncbi:MAG: ABC transporter substrate-binding protein [bacterium]